MPKYNISVSALVKGFEFDEKPTKDEILQELWADPYWVEEIKIDNIREVGD